MKPPKAIKAPEGPMTNLSNAFQPAIDELEKEAADVERQWNALISTINVLRAKAGLPPRPGGGGGISEGAGIALGSKETGVPKIKHDTFFAKKMGTAARLFLEMRFESSGGTSPAKPREFFDALKAGGFVFNTKDDHVAIVSVRNMLTKNTQMFQKLPNGTYGLRSWYPDAKKPKPAAKDEYDIDWSEHESTDAEQKPKLETATTKKAAAAS